MIKRILIGFAAGMFFSSTFVLNRAMRLEGGPQVRSASLRYAYMILFLLILLVITGGAETPGRVLQLFSRHLFFWVLAGSIGFGGFTC